MVIYVFISYSCFFVMFYLKCYINFDMYFFIYTILTYSYNCIVFILFFVSYYFFNYHIQYYQKYNHKLTGTYYYKYLQLIYYRAFFFSMNNGNNKTLALQIKYCNWLYINLSKYTCIWTFGLEMFRREWTLSIWIFQER